MTNCYLEHHCIVHLFAHNIISTEDTAWVSGGTDMAVEDWQARADALALAGSSSFRQLQCALNAFGHPHADKHLQRLMANALRSVELISSLPGTQADVTLVVGDSLLAILQHIRSALEPKTTNCKQLWKALQQFVRDLTQWRQAVLFAWDGIGRLHSDSNAPQMSKPVRLFVDGKYIVDAVDSTDLACQFLQSDSKLAAAIESSSCGKISLAW